jgi:hypothetical protein
LEEIASPQKLISAEYVYYLTINILSQSITASFKISCTAVPLKMNLNEEAATDRRTYILRSYDRAS